MNINIKDSILLSDNNKYGVVSKTIYKNNIYYFLIDTNNFENIKFCLEGHNELIEVKDENLIQKLLPYLAREVKEEIKDLFNT